MREGIPSPDKYHCQEVNNIAENRTRTRSGRRNSGTTILLVVIIALLMMIIAGMLVLILAFLNGNPIVLPGAPGQGAEETETVEKLTDSIALPCYSALYLNAGVREQNITLPNPERNFCQVRMSLVLEDGTVIWTSDLTPPGEEAQIVLETPLEAGVYIVTLQYDCFRMDENQSSLNGGSCQVELHVS